MTPASSWFSAESRRHFLSSGERASELSRGGDKARAFGPVLAASNFELAFGFRETIRKSGNICVRCWDNGPSFLVRVLLSRTCVIDEVIHAWKFQRSHQPRRHFLDGNVVDPRQRSQHRPARHASMLDFVEQRGVNPESDRLDVLPDLLRHLLKRSILPSPQL